MEQGERVWPPSRVATAIVWLLDRLPDHLRHEILESFWSKSDIELIKIKAHFNYARFLGTCEWFGIDKDGSFECCGLPAEYTTCNANNVVCKLHKCQCSLPLN